MLIVQPFVDKMIKKAGWGFDLFNEMISVLVFLAFCYEAARKKRVNSLILLAAIFVLYMLAITVLRGNLPLGVLQIVMYSQFFFYFFYFQSIPKEEKARTIVAFKKIMDVFIWIIFFIGIIELIDHSSFRQFLDVHSVKRGINYFYLISFFGSGPSLAIFISLYVLLWHYYHYSLGNKINRTEVLRLILAIVLGTLSFSRKEVFFIFIFLVFFPYPARNSLNKWAKRLIFFFSMGLGLVVYYLSFFERANTVALDKTYVRWQIVTRSMEVLGDYLPFGTGVGTFGSRVSLLMPKIYKAYDIGPRILGWPELGIRGPIYDAFLFTFTTELGVGILIFLFFLYKLYEAWGIRQDEYSVFSQRYLVIYYLALCFFTPMVTSVFGFLCMSILGLMIARTNLFTLRNWNA